MTRGPTIDEINEHVCFELTWMIFAAERHREWITRRAAVPMLTATLTHARNLIEFAVEPGGRGLRLSSLTAPGRGVTTEDRKAYEDLTTFINQRVAHLDERRGRSAAPWPVDVTGTQIGKDDPDRLLRVAGRVLAVLDDRAQHVRDPERSVLRDLLGRARRYLDDPSPNNHLDC